MSECKPLLFGIEGPVILVFASAFALLFITFGMVYYFWCRPRKNVTKSGSR